MFLKKLRVVAVGALLVAALSACDNTGAEVESNAGGMSEARIRLSDGRVITCIVWKSGYAGGLSCDWRA